MQMGGIARLVLFLCMAQFMDAQTSQENRDESKVKPYTLPDPLVSLSGKRVRTGEQWRKVRRPEILRLFEDNVYGRTPITSLKTRFELVSAEPGALGGKAVRKQVTISFSPNLPGNIPVDTGGPEIHVLLYLPVHSTGPVPVFLGLNFGGNQTVDGDPGIVLPQVWTRERDNPGSNELANHVRKPALEESRGRAASQWQVERILARGYGLATAYYEDIEPDFDGGMRHGVRKLLLRDGLTEPASGDWGAIGAWAWGLSRITDYLVSDKDVDAKRIALMGHSRLGKAALWAGAQDERFAIVISNNSGEGGAALSKRNFGEDVWRLNHNFPHWFAKNYRQYSNREEALPVDQHMLLALIAPRPLYVASASADLHSDPKGEFLAAVHAGPVYEILGKQGLGTDHMPEVHQPIVKTIGYHIREGKHDVTAYDWDRYCDFADLHWHTAAAGQPGVLR